MTNKPDSKESLAKKIDAITEQECKLYHEQSNINKRLMVLKEKKAKFITAFIEVCK